ncbi:DNA-binding response regulator [Bacillus sp. HMF5848]|uniref:response regulator transcription factor n=1 Tax=Bacillus sp. HMF5848 TaxID=2495421 RepID=UPI000F77FBB5|nr:response regulator transcription factor [Bacillus sp. HMF5848]RSK29111.1 DNA-binding response regulator [Bacillus sp. HMF5848]
MTEKQFCRTLIVDDEILIRQGIKHYLDWEQEGFQIVGEASNGEEALAIIDVVHPHIIITDIMMPIMDGEELTRIVKERYPHIEVIILSSYGEFDYVRSTFQSGVVDYILKPKLDAKSLLQVLRKAAKRIPSLNIVDQVSGHQRIEHIIDRLLAGYEPLHDLSAMNETFPFDCFRLLAIKPTIIFSYESLKENVVDRMTTEQDIAAYHIPSIKEQVVFLLNYNEKTDIVNSMNEWLVENNLQGALTEMFIDLLEIENAYNKGLKTLLQAHFYLPNSNLLVEKHLSKLDITFESFNLDWFIEEFKREHFAETFDYLMKHAALMSGHYTLDIYEYKAFFNNIIFNIAVLLNNMQYDVKELESKKYVFFKRIDEAHNAQEVVDVLSEYIEKVKECIQTKHGQAQNPNMQLIKEYVEAHYAESLTLTEVAKHFHFNPSYLSSFFSAHNNESFVEFLSRVRIDKATKLLANHDIAISDVGEMVGYSDHSYFCKVFKKIKGQSPSQYRRKKKF